MASINELLAAHEYKYGRPNIKNTLFETLGNAIADRQARIDEERKAQRDQQMAIDLIAKKFEYEQQQEAEKQKRVAEENARQFEIYKQFTGIEEERKAQREQQQAMDILAKKFEYEQKQEAEKKQQAMAILEKKFEYEQQQESEKQKRIADENARQIEIYKQFTGMDDRTNAGDVKRVVEGGSGKELERKARVIGRQKVTSKYDIIDGKVSVTLEDKSPIELLQEEIAYGFYDTPQEIVKRGMELGADANKLEALATTASIPGVMTSAQGQEGQQIPEGMRSTGYEYKYGQYVPKGLEPIPASEKKAEQEMAMASTAEQTKAETAKMNAESALRSIQDVKSNIKEFGLLGRIPAIPGTSKVVWEKNIDRVKAMLTLEKLMELKRASSTGASGLGALSEGERKNLEDAASALDKGLPPAKAAQYLDEIERTLTKVLQPKSQVEQQKQLPANDPLGLR